MFFIPGLIPDVLPFRLDALDRDRRSWLENDVLAIEVVGLSTALFWLPRLGLAAFRLKELIIDELVFLLNKV